MTLLEAGVGRVELKKVGQKWWGRCPFHEEDTASFYISATSDFFYCFGCGKYGGVKEFIEWTTK